MEVANPFLVINRISDTQGGYFTLAPLYQQAFRWFREKYEIHSYIERLISGAFIYKIDWFEEDRHNKIVWECKSYSFSILS